MRVEIDSGKARTALNAVKVIFVFDPLDPPISRERHVTVTHEGIIVDIVEGGEVISSRAFEHDDLLDEETARQAAKLYPRVRGKP